MISQPIAAPVPVALIEKWVDASTQEGGDGTAALPFKRLEQALEPGAIVNLRSGLYPGPFVLPEGIRLIGHGEVVLYAEGETVVLTATSAQLQTLSVQGGFTGLSAGGGEVTLNKVRFSGHRRVALATRGKLAMIDCLLDGTVSETRGVQLLPGAQAILKQVRFTGAFRRAIDAEDAELDVEDLNSNGPVEALHLEGTRAKVRTLGVQGGRGPAIFVSGGSLTLEDAGVMGHEFALQAKKTALTINRFGSRNAQLAGIATLDCTGTLNAVGITGSGSFGALQLLSSSLSLKGVKIKQGQATGIMVRKGKVTIEGALIEQIRAEREARGESGGDGLHLRDAEVIAKNLTIRDVDGTGVFASAVAQVTLEKVLCERCKVGALVAELGAAITVKGLVARGGQGPAIVVPDKSSLALEDGDVTANEAPIWADCRQGAQVKLRRLKSNLPQPVSDCVERGD